MNSNQRTLFQTWGASASQSKVQPKNNGPKAAAGRRRTTPTHTAQAAGQRPQNPLWTEMGHRSTSECQVREEDRQPAYEDDDDDDDDDLLLVAVYEAEKSLQLESANLLQDDNPVGTRGTSPDLVLSGGQVDYSDFPGFDSSSAKVWIYPTNYPIREYQLNISQAALFQNTLVCLPTGLGKTFIAAVVMYNFYRWYPSGKIVFMAPTKPLVAQQIEACYKVMGIPQAHMAELTGSTAAAQRQEVWKSRRVFFLTPQVMVNDLSRDTCPAGQVKCVVIDEAHKALGNHAYCQVIRQLGSQTLQFRVLALSATPGGDTKSVQQVISNLLISHIELRSEESPDIRAHSHQRSVEKMVVPLGEALAAHQARYLQVLEKFMSRLVQNRMMVHKDLRSLTKYQLILARDQFRKNPPPNIKGPQQGMLEGDFAICISLYHGYELLMQMGLRSLFFYIQGIMDGSKEMSRARNELQRTPTFMDLYHEMEAMFVKPSTDPEASFVYSHPKLKTLEEVVLQHFRTWADNSATSTTSASTSACRPPDVSTRVMIFSSFRESVQEIADMLNRQAPLIRVMTFMGQASAGKGVKGFTQKVQLEVVRRFRDGGFNTLVSTCVGEEGLDIGEVDLIVCFDAQKNPTRLVQRMGRTGRKRQGRIVVILAEGREERTYNESQSKKRSVDRSIISSKNSFHMYPNSPRMMPEGVNPTLHKMHITCGQFDPRESSRRSGKGRRSDSEGGMSLMHPKNLIRQGRVKSDGFLDSAEYSLWASTMRLEEDEAHPNLRRSHFMCLPSDQPPQEDVSRSGPPSRELSLWEWRHWQNKEFPTHRVDHSLRCRHFVKVMELIDRMREESEGKCAYEQELLPYRHKADAVGQLKSGRLEKTSCRKRQKPTTSHTTAINKAPKPSSPSSHDFQSIGEDGEREVMRGTGLMTSLALKKQSPPVEHEAEAPFDEVRGHTVLSPPPSNNDDPDVGMEEDCVIVEEEDIIQTGLDEDVGLESLFYLPKWDPAPSSSPKVNPEKTTESLRIVLANVAELLSKSPPPLSLDLEASLCDPVPADTAAPSPPPSPRQIEEDRLPPQPFQVSFTLDIDDDDEMMICHDLPQKPPLPNSEPVQEPLATQCDGLANSQNWDEVFDDEVSNDYPGSMKDCMDEELDDEIVCDVKEEQVGHRAEEKEEIKSCELRNEELRGLMDSNSPDRHHPPHAELPAEEQCRRPRMDDSMDLFGDDEAFLQMSIPEIPTPEDCVTPNKSPKDIPNVSAQTHTPMNASNTAQPHDLAHRSNSNTHTRHSLHANQTPQAASAHNTALYSEAKDENAAEINEDMWETNTEHLLTHRTVSHCQVMSPTMQHDPESFDSTHDFFSVNFDLGDSDEDSEADTAPAPGVSVSPGPGKHRVTPPSIRPSIPPLSHASTPCYSFHRPKPPPPPHSTESKSSTPQTFSGLGRRSLTSPLASPLMSKSGILTSPITSQGCGVRTPLPGSCAPRTPVTSLSLKRRLLHGGTSGPRRDALPPPSVSGDCSFDSDDEIVVHKRRHQGRANPLSSPDASKISSDVDSPLLVDRKRAAAHVTSDETEGEAASDDDFQNESVFRHRSTAPGPERQRGKAKQSRCRTGRQFLDEEAELSEEEVGGMSSDEEDGDDQNRSLEGFVVDNMHFSQGLNDSEMQGIYLKSVRSPAVAGKFKMSYKSHHNMDIFSQVPEMDETYAEDSFVVGSDVEELENSEEEEEEDVVDLMIEESYVDGRKQYATRRRVFLHKAAAGTSRAQPPPPPESRAGVKTKRSRVIRVEDSSEEETENDGAENGLVTGRGGDVHVQPKTTKSSKPQQLHRAPSSSSSSSIASKVSLLSRERRGPSSEEQLNERCRQRIEIQHLVSDELDFEESESLLASRKSPQTSTSTSSVLPPQRALGADTSAGESPAPAGPVRILVDSRCLSKGVELMTSLRQRHNATVHVCSLDGSYFVVSNRMAVERHGQSDLAAMQNRKRFAERVNGLQGLFERVCLIVEKDRTKPGEPSRPFQRTRYYDGTLAALVRIGVRLLWSDGPEESAALLADMARLEQRKGQDIRVPLEVKGQHRQQALQLYLSLPSVSYVQALNLSHNFTSVAQLINSPVEAIQTGGCMSQSRAEEVYRFLRYSCDSLLMNTSAGKIR
ncbi:Fanconi anemia group M protein [Genypterus blacodes]|uniref:Fanconi anemia group M protein n=1 Tax=Genypterus blacodes TaxID=154954 RepID=UPI003F774156